MAMGGDFIGDLVADIENQAKIVRNEWLLVGMHGPPDCSKVKEEIENLRKLCEKALSGGYFSK